MVSRENSSHSDDPLTEAMGIVDVQNHSPAFDPFLDLLVRDQYMP